MNIIYSFNKKGFEAAYWTREIAAVSSERYTFIPFNHDPYLNVSRYIRAQLLDNLFYAKDPDLLRMYADFTALIEAHGAEAVIVDNCFPYHPEFLMNLPIYKVMYTTDGPLTAYDRDFAYLHAYDHIFYHSPAYSPELAMAKKLQYCGADNIDFWPHALFDACFDSTQSEASILSHERDIDIIFIGALFVSKMPLLAKVKKAFGSRFRLLGLANWKKNLYFNLKFGFPGRVRRAEFEEFIPLYQRSKIGINVHNRGDYTVGSYRLFDLPGNGVMQISDGGQYLNDFFDVGKEIVGFRDADDLIEKLHYYLDHHEEREQIALNGYRRVIAEHRYSTRMEQAGQLIEKGMARIGWGPKLKG